MAALLDEHGTRLREVDGIEPVLVGRLLGRTGSPDRFVPAAAYANYTGTALVQIASPDSSRHRLARDGDRKPNSAIHPVAMVQIRMSASAGRAYYDKKIAGGTSHRNPRSHDTSLDTSGASCTPTKIPLPDSFRR